jgi:hypothetical protein
MYKSSISLSEEEERDVFVIVGISDCDIGGFGNAIFFS